MLLSYKTNYLQTANYQRKNMNHELKSDVLIVQNWDKQSVRLKSIMEVYLYKVDYNFDQDGFLFTFDGHIESTLEQYKQELKDYDEFFWSPHKDQAEHERNKENLKNEIAFLKGHLEKGTKMIVFWQTPEMQNSLGLSVDDESRPTFDEIFQQWAIVNPDKEPFIRSGN